MKWVIGILAMADVAFQLFGTANNEGWMLYYNLIHFGFTLSVCWYFIYDKLVPYFFAYFGFVTINLVMQYTRDLSTDTVQPIYSWAMLLLILLSIYIYKTKWGK